MSTLILLDLKGTKKGLFFVVSVISFRYEGKTAALNMHDTLSPVHILKSSVSLPALCQLVRLF